MQDVIDFFCYGQKVLVSEVLGTCYMTAVDHLVEGWRGDRRICRIDKNRSWSDDKIFPYAFHVKPKGQCVMCNSEILAPYEAIVECFVLLSFDSSANDADCLMRDVCVRQQVSAGGKRTESCDYVRGEIQALLIWNRMSEPRTPKTRPSGSKSMH